MATSRLKKKVERNVGSYGENLLESFVSLGTPLPSLASKVDAGEFKPIWEQEVVDDKGRRRLHGAFTGGFSAGYFNTVGSKEGWTPSTFTSSRTIRGANDGGKTTEERAKDLMDDEDLADLASSRTLSTADAYAPSSAPYDPLLGNFGSLSASGSNPAATALLASLIQPASTRIGARLMRRMGWRDGQGVGPRVTLQQRRAQAADLGIKLDEEGQDTEEAEKHYYAPMDRPLASLEEVGIATDRGWGLGYKAGPSIPVSARREAAGPAYASYDDEGEDDVYSGSSSFPSKSGSKRDWAVVDLDEDEELHRVSRTGGRAPRKNAAPSTKEGFHDGTRVLTGFTVQRDLVTGTAISALPPAPPRNWEPKPQRLWADFSGPQDKGKGKQLDADERGNLLGEAQPPVLPKSVFDYLSAKDKQRLATLTAPKSAAPSMEYEEPQVEAVLLIPPLEGPTALAALKGFQPFSASSTSPDPIRQARYTLFLQFKAHILPPSNSTLPFGPRQLPGGSIQTIAELNRELDDYAKSAMVFKPVSGMLAGRFTSGGSGGLPATAAEPGLYQPVPKAPPLPADLTPAGIDISKLTPAQNAARLGTFGHLTRTVDSFAPAKLVCKRFGVPVPHVEEPLEDEDMEPGGAWKEAGSGKPSKGGTGEVLGKASMDALMMSSGFRRFQPPEEVVEERRDQSTVVEAGVGRKSVPEVQSATIATIGLGDDEAQGAETLTYTKAPRDIFAAIFADSDDEDSDEEGGVIVEATLPPSTTTLTSAPLPVPADVVSEEEPIDIILSSSTISSYRPSFVPSVPRDSKPVEPKKKKRKAPARPLSFDVDDGEESFVPTKKASGKRSKAAKEEVIVEEVEEWVEVKSLPTPTARGRPRAADLYE